MYPVLLRLPGINLYSWGVTAAVGFGLASLYFLGAMRSAKVSEEASLNLLVGIIVTALVGSRVFYVAFHLPLFLREPTAVYQVWKGGMVLYGGLIAGFAFALYYIRRRALPFGLAADSAAPAIAFGLAVGRIGCLLNGCCYGYPSAWGLVFPPGCPAAQAFPGMPLFPTQPVSAGALVIIGTMLHLLRRKALLTGSLFPLLLVLYGIYRFTIEFFRGDTGPVISYFTTFQLISVALVAVGSGWIVWNNHRTK
jgi:phosphatidylglycerol:prolipoprotein diacylglycerol transferase